MKRQLKRLLGPGLALLLPAVVDAQEPADEEPDVRRYTVEFVIFRYTEDVGLGTEIFPPEELPVEESYSLPAEDGEEGPIFSDVPIVAPAAPPAPDEADADPAVAGETPDRRARLDLVLSLGDTLTIESVIDRLERLEVYEPMLRGGWTQVTVAKEDAVPLELTLFGDPPPDLEGSFTLYVGRFLHLVVDLTLDAAPDRASATDDEPAFTFGDSRFGFDRNPFRSEGKILLRIQEDRIMRNGETRYFDHPKFGVIAKVIRVEPPEESEGDSAEPTPLVGTVRQ